MFSKNLKYYRLKNNLTMKELAERIDISPMAVSNYEKGKRKPDMKLIEKMADALDVRVADFLATRNKNITFVHGDFRKNYTLFLNQQEYIKESIEEYFNRFMNIIELLGEKVLPEPPVSGSLELTEDVEMDAELLRKHLNLASDGPVGNLIELLENKGILVYICGIDNNKFFGINGFVNEWPYIVLNKNMSPERNRSTIVHELAHLMFKWPDNMKDNEIEMHATAISGAFLFPKIDAIRELGVQRTVISKDMILVAKEYGISMYLLVKRAQIINIINKTVAKNFFVNASRAGWRKNEPIRIEKETTSLFEQLVYRGINENEISIQKGAELLQTSYDEVAESCCFYKA